MAKIKIEGLDKLQKVLKDNVTMDDVKRVVRHNGAQLQDKMQVKADFKKGYQTGTTKRSIFLEIEDSVWLTYYQEGNILYVFVMGKAFTITLPEAVQGDTLITANGTLNCNIQVNDFNKETV